MLNQLSNLITGICNMFFIIMVLIILTFCAFLICEHHNTSKYISHLQEQIDVLEYAQFGFDTAFIDCVTNAGRYPQTDTELEAAEEANTIAKAQGWRMPYPTVEEENLKYEGRIKPNIP